MTEQNKCVYIHKDKLGNPFYVGSGSLQRANTKQLSKSKNRGTCRGKAYSQKVEELCFEYDVEIISSDLSKEQSILLESKTIIELREQGYCLVNKNTPKPYLGLNRELLCEYFCIDECSPTGLSWAKDYGQYKYKYKANDVAGVNETGYLRVCLFGTTYQVHRVIMLLLGHDLNGKVIDHIDGNIRNNKIENLRVVTQAENLRNLSKRCDNTSGHVGINYVEHKSHWIINWYDNGKRLTKCFSIIEYSNSIQLALDAAKSFRKLKVEELGYIAR